MRRNILLLPLNIVAGVCIINAVMEKNVITAVIAVICLIIIVAASIRIDKSNR